MLADEGCAAGERAPLMDPTDPTGRRVICKDRDEVDAMLSAATIHPQLPKMLYLRKRKKTLREIGRACGIGKSTVADLIERTKK